MMPCALLPTALEEEILTRLRTRGRLEAILHIRETRGAGLREAVEMLNSLETKSASSIADSGEPVGMTAEIIAVGRYSKSVAEHMDYSAERYATTREGAVVTRRLFGIGEGSSLSRQFASFLGITDPWDFNQHKIDSAKIDLAGLRKWAETYTDYDEDVETLAALLSAGFEFHFRPEG